MALSTKATGMLAELLNPIGWVSQVCLSISVWPMAFQAFKYKAIYLNIWGLSLWTAGEITGLVYVGLLGEYPLIFNYGCNTIMLLVLWRYRKDPKNDA